LGEKQMKQLTIAVLFSTLTLRAFCALVPYVQSLDSAEAIAIVTVTACEQTFDGRHIRSSATLTVDTPIAGVKNGETFKQSFGLPQAPGTWKNGTYSRKTVLASEGLSFEIAERYLVLLKKKEDGWSVTRDSGIIDDMISDGYFEEFAGAHEVSVSKAIELLKAHRRGKEPNKSSTAQRP
jgi:hypothetical protein